MTDLDERPDPDTLVLLKICRDQVDAMSVRSLLESEGIEVLVQGEHHRAMEGALLGAMIELRAMVRFADLEVARELLEELDYAEHLPAEEVEPDPDDRSLRQFQERSPAVPAARRDARVAAALAVVLPFGAGHFYAGRKGFALGIAAIQLFNLVFWLKGWNVSRMVLLVVVFDAVFSGVAIRRDRQHDALDE